MVRFRRTAALVVAFVLGASLRADPWPVVDSDLHPDPKIHWGVLPNGLRYAVRHNSEPKGRASLRLLVAAGSMDESERERGIAHFIEHMAYRGTREHPNGGLTAELQRLGVGFGPDTAAYTFWDHTIYQLELPDTSEATLREGLGVFREYARDITFDPRLIESERDVILNERDMRDTPGARASNANMGFLWPGSRQVERAPIGLAENIRRFTRGELLSFYNAWYSPERMAVVVVGDVDPDAVARLIVSALGGIKAQETARDDKVLMVPLESSKPDISVFVDNGLQGAECEMEHPYPDPVSPDTHARRVARLRRSLAFSMLRQRAARFSKTSDTGFVVPVSTITNVVPGWAVADFGGSGTIKNWKTFMADLEREHRRAFNYGFTAPELAVARAAFASGYEDAVRTSETWRSDWMAGAIADSIVSGYVFCTPVAIQKDMEADLAAATPAECLTEFRRAWTAGSMHVFVATNSTFGVTASEIASALNSSRETAVTPPVEREPIAFGYTQFGTPGQITHSEQVKDLDVWQAEFANGVRLNFKATPFEAGSVVICLRVGTGRLSQPRLQPGLDLLANAIVPLGGLGKHSAEDLQEALAGHQVKVSFGVDGDSLDFNARCSPKDLGLCLRLIAAHLADSAYRMDSMPQARASVMTMYSSLDSSPSGPISMQSTRVLSGGDLRFGTATYAEFSTRTVAEVREWIEPQFRTGPIELSIVGDTSWEAASREVAETLGALPQRMERSAVAPPLPLNPPQSPSKPVYLGTTNPSLRQVAIARFCAVPNLSGTHMERRCRMLAALLDERLRVRLRVELGAAYAFAAEFSQYDGFPNFSFFFVTTTVAPEHAQRADVLIKEEIESLRRGHFTDDEFERVKLPFIREREADERDNSYWGSTVLRDAQQRPERLAAARDRLADDASIGRSDVEALAAAYFGKTRWFAFVAYPRSPELVRPQVQPFSAKINLGTNH